MNNNDGFNIRKLLKQIHENKLCVPIIQRDFIWGPDRIELLFDSLLREYPIGTMLLWHYDKSILENFDFYTLCKYGSEDKLVVDEKQQIPESFNDRVAILDGQQRLTSLYIGFCGYYKIRKKGTRKSNEENYQDYYLYIDMTSIEEYKDEDLLMVKEKKYNIKFLTKEETKTEKKWLRFKDFFDNNNTKINEIKKEYPDKINEINEISKKIKNILKSKDIIKIFYIENKQISEVLEIFERVNSFGKPLKKTDLIFSSIVRWWPDARGEMINLLKNINNKNNLYGLFDIDYIVKTSLILIGEPAAVKLSNITKKNIEKIKNNEWDDIKKYINKSATLVSKMNIFKNNLTSANSIIPITYFMHKNKKIFSDLKDNFKRYLQMCIIKKIYSHHGDTVLQNMINAIDNGDLKEWTLEEFKKLKIDGEYNFRITKENIDDMLNCEKGDKSLFVLSIIYDDIIKYDDYPYEQDHIHPKKKFKRNININFPNATSNQKDELIKKNNRVPNLELMTEDINKDKGEQDLIDIYKQKKYNKYFKCMPEKKFYKIEEFENFYKIREKLIREKLYDRFGVEKSKNTK